MPLTFPAHQAAVIPLKLWKPRWFDGIALVVGSGSPDLFYAFADTNLDSHSWQGIWVTTAFAIAYSILLRRYAVDGLFGSVPDFGPLRLRNYRVLRLGRPRLLVTALSSFIGVFSHVAIDSFTHAGRFGSNLFGLQRTLVDSPFGEVSGARLLQYLGHTVGSLVGMILFVLVVSRRHLGEWYGPDQIHVAQRAPVHPAATRRLGLVLGACLVFSGVWGDATERVPIFHLGLCVVIGLLFAGTINRAPEPIDTSPTDRTVLSRRGT